jgi:rubrerythrin
MNMTQIETLLLQSLEHEIGGTKVYRAALSCALNADLKKEWKKYLEETEKHVSVLTKLCSALGIDPAKEVPGRAVVRHIGAALVEAMKMASAAGDPMAAQLVACECVVNAETKDHLDWQLIGKCADHLGGGEGEALKRAYDEVEDQEDGHLYHSKGWCRELWIESLGLKAVLPPPEERRHVTTAIGAAKAEQSAEKSR